MRMWIKQTHRCSVPPKWRDGFASRTKIGPYPNVQLVAATLEPTSAAPSERKNIQDSETCYR